MGIKIFFDKEIIVSRLKTISGNKKAFSTTATVDCAIQEMDRNAKVAANLVDQRGWIAYFDIEDENRLREGYMITDADGLKYKVFEKTVKDYGINQHVEVLLVEY